MNINDLNDKERRLTPRQWAMLSDKANNFSALMWKNDSQVLYCAEKLRKTPKELRKEIQAGKEQSNNMPYI